MPMPPENVLRTHADGVLLSVKLQPRASKNEIGAELGGELKIKVTAPPVDAAANEALVKFLAQELECPRGKVELVRGHTSRHKTILLHGFKPENVLSKLTGG
jgi:uncharacterized protein (TIGR00251 family)